MATISQISDFDEILDVRSPSEFAEDHLLGAVNLPVFSDIQRITVGSQHKHDPFAARRLGASWMAANIAAYLQDGLLADRPPSWRPLVYCARGGQRSSATVDIICRIGWHGERLDGGYKAYRQHVMTGLETLPPRLRWIVISGKTGVGKTRLLSLLAERGVQTLDLEALANHRGSTFGGRGEQPSQRRFETLLFNRLADVDVSRPIFAEAESRKIGAIHLPAVLLTHLRQAAIIRLEADLSQRVRHLLEIYRQYGNQAVWFESALTRLRPFAGADKISRWRQLYYAGRLEGLLSELLTDFYDPGYERSLRKNYTAIYQTAPYATDPTDAAVMAAVADNILAASTNVR